MEEISILDVVVTTENWQKPLSDSKLETEDRENVWKETREGLKCKDAPVSALK